MSHPLLAILVTVILLITPPKNDSSSAKTSPRTEVAKTDESSLVKWLDIAARWLDIASKAVVILGLPVGLFQYARTKKKEKRDREYGTYNALDLQYIEFQKLCLEHSDLNIFDVADDPAPKLTPKQAKEELILFTMLFSIFERAYLLYQSERSDQWHGWESYINSYCQRENFLRAWEISGKTFDTNFEAYMATIIEHAKREKSA